MITFRMSSRAMRSPYGRMLVFGAQSLRLLTSLDPCLQVASDKSDDGSGSSFATPWPVFLGIEL